MVSRVCFMIAGSLIALGCEVPVQTVARQGAAGPAAVTAARLTAADSEPGQWLSHGRTYGLASSEV